MKRWAALVFAAGVGVRFVDGCCKGAPPDPTFVDSNEYFLSAVFPNRGSIGGGSRITVKGQGFNVNFFTAGNYVYIGSTVSNTWVPCDIIEGACTVQCGGPKTLICDTQPWSYGALGSDANGMSSGWLDVKVIIETFRDTSNGGSVEVGVRYP